MKTIFAAALGIGLVGVLMVTAEVVFTLLVIGLAFIMTQAMWRKVK